MRILVLCKKFPYPPREGETIVIWNEIVMLKNLGYTIDILTLNTQKHYIDIHSVQDITKEYATIYSVDIDTTPSISAVLKNMVSPIPYYVSRFVSTKFRTDLIHLIQKNEYQNIIIHGSFLLPYLDTIRAYFSNKIILRSHNIEHEIWERTATIEKSFLRKIAYKKIACSLKKYELEKLQAVDALIGITKRDINYLEKNNIKKPYTIIPAGVSENWFISIKESLNTISCFFLGGMDWLPNYEGIRWFMEKVWTNFSKNKQTILHIAGRNFPNTLFQKKSNTISLHGEIPDALAFMAAHDILVVPLHSGGGMRIKIVEAMAAGKIVISTAIGAEGIEYTHQENIWIANTAAEFTSALEIIYADEQLRKKIATNAQKLAQEKYANHILEKKLGDFLSTLN